MVSMGSKCDCFNQRVFPYKPLKSAPASDLIHFTFSLLFSVWNMHTPDFRPLPLILRELRGWQPLTLKSNFFETTWDISIKFILLVVSNKLHIIYFFQIFCSITNIEIQEVYFLGVDFFTNPWSDTYQKKVLYYFIN